MKINFRDAMPPMRGCFRLRVYKRGKLVEEYQDRNLIVNGARDAVARLISGAGEGKQIARIAFGTGGNIPTPDDTAITNPFTKPILSASYPETGQVMFAIRRLIVHLSRFYRQNGFSNEGYALLIDFSKFYDNIDHDILLELLGGHIRDRRVMELTEKFIRVFGDGKALGLGSQVSQISAIFYPSKLDHFIKEKLRIEFYGRYMDDLYLIHHDKKHLEYCLGEIRRICDSLKITVNLKKTRIVKLSQGLVFLKGKYSLLAGGRILRLPCRDSAIRMKRKLKKFKTLLEAGKMDFNDIRNAYQSWRGAYKKRFQVFHKIQKIDRLYDELFIK